VVEHFQRAAGNMVKVAATTFAEPLFRQAALSQLPPQSSKLFRTISLMLGILGRFDHTRMLKGLARVKSGAE